MTPSQPQPHPIFQPFRRIHGGGSVIRQDSDERAKMGKSSIIAECSQAQTLQEVDLRELVAGRILGKVAVMLGNHFQ